MGRVVYVPIALQEYYEEPGMRLTSTSLLVAMLFCCFSIGCAFVDRTTDLTYYRNLKTPKGTGVVYLATPTEEGMKRDKNGQTIIGPVRNGYGMWTANVLTSTPVTQWVGNAYITELSAAGYETKSVDKLPPSCPMGIEICVEKAWGDLDMGFFTIGALGEVTYRIRLYSKGQLEKEIRVEGLGQGPRAAAAMPDTLYKDSLTIALRAATKETMPLITKTFQEAN